MGTHDHSNSIAHAVKISLVDQLNFPSMVSRLIPTASCNVKSSLAELLPGEALEFLWEFHYRISQHAPLVDHLRIFGSIEYALISSQKREKFDEKGEKYLFIGYSDESKGYRLLNPLTNQLIVSRDVIFDESAVWEWKNKQISYCQSFETDVPSTSQADPSQTSNLEQNSASSPSRAVAEIDSESPPRKHDNGGKFQEADDERKR
ncbi:hypothetical protein EZV62_008234 [Acer yangbiense]|uniref:Retroviral polymerase SH3-like domain-containing protein n=1 Tax=Acer yangbiense TaxID=1000413 RepID=A0A5C7IDH8_9ROSI|nr:hypothetical protein EZV62_008234 [Acer yangbiense]